MNQSDQSAGWGSGLRWIGAHQARVPTRAEELLTRPQKGAPYITGVLLKKTAAHEEKFFSNYWSAARVTRDTEGEAL